MQITEKQLINFQKGRQTHIITEDDTLNNKDEILLNDKVEAQITAKSVFNTIDDCLKIIPYDLFGYDSEKEAIDDNKDKKKIVAYRVKVTVDSISLIYDNEELLDLIDESSIQKNEIGFSSSEVFEIVLKDGRKAVLKIQSLSSRNDLKDENSRLKWLEGKINTPKVYYYKELNKIKYLVMEKLEGLPAYKVDDFASLAGKTLREIHNTPITDCKFIQNSVKVLYKNAVDNIDIIVPSVQEEYPDMTKEDILEFLRTYKPKDKVLVHGDYSLPNILIDNGKVNLIDVGDVSISTKYFDLFYLRKSLIRNKKIDKFPELIKAYGRIRINENYMKWICIVDKALF